MGSDATTEAYTRKSSRTRLARCLHCQRARFIVRFVTWSLRASRTHQSRRPPESWVTVDLKAPLAVLYRNLQQAATRDDAVPAATFEAATSGLPLDDASRARPLAEPARMRLHIHPHAVRPSPSRDIRHVKKVVRPHTEFSQTERTTRPRVRTALDVLALYADEGTVTELAVSRVARLTGLTPSVADALKASTETQYRVVPDDPSTHSRSTPGHEAAEAGPPATPIAGCEGDLASRRIRDPGGHERGPLHEAAREADPVGGRGSEARCPHARRSRPCRRRTDPRGNARASSDGRPPPGT